MSPMSLPTLALLWTTGFFAGFVDSIAGGGGIVSLPMLLATGMPPHMALGTNKLQGTFGSFTATVNYSRKGLVSLREIPMGVLWTAIGAVTGTVSVQWVDASFLSHLILFLLVGVFVYTIASPGMGRTDTRAKMARPVFFVLAGFSLGFYDGFFGPGTGSFWTVALVIVMGLNLKKATAHTKVFNFTSNIVALIAFFIAGQVVLSAGLAMGVGQMVGAYFGSRLVIRRGTGFVRVIFIIVVVATIGRLGYTTYFSH